MTHTVAATEYRRNAVLTASPEKLVKMLYDGAIRHMERCRLELSDPATARSAAAGDELGKTFAIVAELRSSLDESKGVEVARDLGRLYDYVLDCLSEANLARDATPVEHGLRVMRTLKEAWDGIIPA